ncbi:SAM-dependent DNA methyltransferase, partial [TM7 phylum sp. oral taxon 346]
MQQIHDYLAEIKRQFHSGHAIEHAYRPALQRLMETFDDVVAVNDPKHSEHGAPDFVFLKQSNNSIIRGYAEAKDITVNLDKTEKTNQMERYAGYTNLVLTDYLEFRFYKNGEKYETVSLGCVKQGKLHLQPENGERLLRELQAFLDLPPESIKSGRRLAQIMGGKARRIRDNVEIYLKSEYVEAHELEKIYEMMKRLLVHDLDETKFADMYAQTLVYGLFVARYGDDTPENFTRSEARDLVPASNPFLRHFFDHIAGTGFDKRLAKIVDELCEIFSVSDVRNIVHRHLRIADNNACDTKDPIIHFYEDFLQSYDSLERKKMGAYYTPTPVVRFIVRQID